MTKRERGVVLALGGLFILGGPSYHQVFGLDHPLLKAWEPYGGPATEVCIATYEVVEDGVRRPVSRLEALHGAANWWEVDLHLRRLPYPADVERAGQQLCRALRVYDVRARARCGTVEGYAVAEDGERNLCQARRR